MSLPIYEVLSSPARPLEAASAAEAPLRGPTRPFAPRNCHFTENP
jgi:hypothetical protein